MALTCKPKPPPMALAESGRSPKLTTQTQLVWEVVDAARALEIVQRSPVTVELVALRKALRSLDAYRRALEAAKGTPDGE
jgi:hypothetical protein